MKKILISLFALFLIVILASPYDGAAKKGRKGIFKNIMTVFRPPSAQEQKNIAQKLELTEEQRPKMKELNDKYRKQSSTLKKKYSTAYNDVVSLMNQQSPNKQKVNQKLKAFHSTHSNLVDAEVQYWMDLKTILTPAQNNKLWEIFEQSRIRR